VIDYKYFAINWNHLYDGEPVSFYIEIDPEGYESRKIAIFNDGRMEAVYTDAPDSGSTSLSELPWPGIDAVNSNEEENCNVSELSPDEFESIWKGIIVLPH
jgi:hypothetical protein